MGAIQSAKSYWLLILTLVAVSGCLQMSEKRQLQESAQSLNDSFIELEHLLNESVNLSGRFNSLYQQGNYTEALTTIPTLVESTDSAVLNSARIAAESNKFRTSNLVNKSMRAKAALLRELAVGWVRNLTDATVKSLKNSAAIHKFVLGEGNKNATANEMRLVDSLLNQVNYTFTRSEYLATIEASRELKHVAIRLLNTTNDITWAERYGWALLHEAGAVAGARGDSDAAERIAGAVDILARHRAAAPEPKLYFCVPRGASAKIVGGIGDVRWAQVEAKNWNVSSGSLRVGDSIDIQTSPPTVNQTSRISDGEKILSLERDPILFAGEWTKIDECEFFGSRPVQQNCIFRLHYIAGLFLPLLEVVGLQPSSFRSAIGRVSNPAIDRRFHKRDQSAIRLRNPWKSDLGKSDVGTCETCPARPRSRNRTG